MYELDLKTCTAGDVILRSLKCHPSLFRETIDRARNAHRDAAETMLLSVHSTVSGRATAHRLAGKCARLLQAIDDMIDGQLDARLVVGSDFDERIIAFTAAYRLQCIPASLAREIVER